MANRTDQPFVFSTGNLSLTVLALLSILLGHVSQESRAQHIDFAQEIRPILSSQCAHCHGPDEGNRQSDFRIDTEVGAFADLGGAFGFVPGKPEESEALRRILSEDPDEQMPPPDSGKSVSVEEVQLLRRWINEGATWQEHWAFVPPQRPNVPAVTDQAWVHNPIDAFVLSRLESAGLRPSPDADDSTLLRRLTLDLLGLPPTVAELEAFAGPAADYDREVERLLRSPHYGERWGRIWLDAARYADSDGFEKDKPRNVWMYRDWVIQSLNQDLPYDQFILEQIAGDLLPNATQDQIVATGFLRNSMLNEEGGVDPEQFRMEAMFDRMDAVGKAVLGLTIQCAQCHNHKYDPLTQTDYYRMFALLNNSDEAAITVYTPENRAQAAQIHRQVEMIEARLQAENPKWKQDLRSWILDRAQHRSAWTPLPIENAGDNSQRYFPQADFSLLTLGYAPTKHVARFSVTTDLEDIRAFRLEALTDPNLPAGGPGRSVEGLFALTEFKVEVASVATPDDRKWIGFRRARADFSNSERRLGKPYGDKEGNRGRTGPVAFAIDGDDDTAWGVDAGPGRRNTPRQAIFETEENIAQPGGTQLTFHLVQKHGGWNSDDNQTMNMGRFRVSASAAMKSPSEQLVPHSVEQLLDRDPQEWTDREWRTAFRYWRTQVSDWQTVNDEIEALWRSHPEGTTQLVYAERPAMRSTFRLTRGDFLQPNEAVRPGVPAFLHPLQKEDPTRLDLARWLVDRDAPTTARAIVNRVWQAYFGSGFVATSEDLGVQGETPSHPELLDWLAVEFMEHDWSLKHLHRIIVQSHTYRQSSRMTPEHLERDPANRLFSRASRFRVDAEIIRDISLVASGLLNSKVGGPSVYPPIPEFLLQPPASYGPKTWATETGIGKYRRALYTFRFRSTPYPVLQVFDAPNGDTACVRRDRSNTPLQALATLNEPLFVECARSLAGLTLKHGGATESQQIAFAFRRCVGRLPTDSEAAVLLTLLNDLRRDLAEDRAALPSSTQSPSSTPSPGNSTGVAATTELDLAAWMLASRVLLNLDETLTRE